MAGRAHGDERVPRLLAEHLVDRVDGAPGAAQRRLEAARRHRGVGIQPDQPLVRRGLPHLLDIVARMRERDHVEFRHRRLLARQCLELLIFQRALDRAQTVRPLGMSVRRQVIETGLMAQEKCRHARAFCFPTI